MCIRDRYYLFKAGGIKWEEWRSRFNALGIPLISAHADFTAPSAFGDELRVISGITEWGTSSFKIVHVFLNKEVTAAVGYKNVFSVWAIRQTPALSDLPLSLRR